MHRWVITEALRFDGENKLEVFVDNSHHPSVWCWSVGNEVMERTALECQMTARKLIGRVHSLDPYRPVTSAMCLISYLRDFLYNGVDDNANTKLYLAVKEPDGY